MLSGLICIELSNLPLYFVYDFLKKNNEKDINHYKKLLNYKEIQLVIYGFFRILITIFSYKKIFIGAYWLQHQIKGYFKTKNEYKELLKNENNK